jgi:NAD-dependent SIR2 family protein deacetylase
VYAVKNEIKVDTLLESVCGDCHAKWDMKPFPAPFGNKTRAVATCPKCGGTPSSIKKKLVGHPKGYPFVTEETVAPARSHILDADW